MDNIDILNNCLALTKCGFYISVNEHKDVYETVTEYIDRRFTVWEEEDLDPNIRTKMAETDTIVRIQAYTETPIGSYTVYHYNLKQGLIEMLKIIEEEQP